MKRRVVFTLAGTVALAALVTSGMAATGNPFAGGHGNLISGGSLRTFSFSAVEQADGAVTGNAQVKNRSLGVTVHIDVDCLQLVGENRAIVGGLTTQSSNPSVVGIGRSAVFGVEDNGEGSGAPPDRITTIPDYAPPKSCEEFTFVDDTLRELANPNVVVRQLTPVLDGNIQVRP